MEYTEYATAHACKTSDRQSYRSPLPCSVLKHTRKYRNTTVHGIPLHHYRKYDLKKKHYFFCKSQPKFYHSSLELFSQRPSQSKTFLSLWNLKHYYCKKPWIIWKMSGRRAKRSENLDLQVVGQHKRVSWSFGVVAFRIIWCVCDFYLCLTLSPELLSWRRRPSSVIHQLTLISHGSRPNFMESYLSAISPEFFFLFFSFFFQFSFFFFFLIFIFYFQIYEFYFFFTFVNMGPYLGRKF